MMQDGEVFSGRADHAHGSTMSRMDFEDVARKFRRCAAYCHHPQDQITAIESMVWSLDQLETADSLLNAFISKQ